jgi:hypothetical protein
MYSTQKSPKHFDGPVPLLEINDRGMYGIHPDGAAILNSIQGRIGIITVIGPYRSGKSFLLNMLMGDGERGFEVGRTVNACTSGLWICPSIIHSTNKSVVFIDSEGFGSTARSVAQDSKLFALSMLLSSALVYNSVGVINENALNQMMLSVYLSENLILKVSYNQTQETESSEDITQKLASLAPKFIWVLRDFVLSLEDKNGRAISPNEYLEKVLTESFRMRGGDRQKLVRDTLTKVFTDRECVTLPRPVESEEDLQRLNSLELDLLRHEFISEFRKLRRSVVDNCPCKKMNGLYLSGRHVLGLLNQYVEAVNQGGIPNVISSWQMILEEEYEKRLNQGKKEYNSQRNQVLEELPVEDTILKTKIKYAKDNAETIVMNSEFREETAEQKALNKLRKYFDRDIEFVIRENYTASLMYNLSILEGVFIPIFHRLEAKGYGEDLDILQRDWSQ